MRYAARVDANHAAVAGAFKACGAEVLDLSRLGGGVPDLLVYVKDRLALIEVKDGGKSPSRRKLTAAQVVLHQKFPVLVVTKAEEVAGLVAAL